MSARSVDEQAAGSAGGSAPPPYKARILSLSAAAQACVDEAGIDPEADVCAQVAGGGRGVLLRIYRDGADEERRQGWVEYVDAVCAEADRRVKFGAGRARVRDDDTDSALPGFASDGLELLSAGGRPVNAYYTGLVWEYLPESQSATYRAMGYRVVRVVTR